MIIASQRNRLAHAIDFVLTLAAWWVLLYLLLHGLIKVSSTGLDSALPRLYLTDWSAAGTLGGYLATGLLNALLLFSWARYNQRRFERAARRGAFKPVRPEELCRKFILTERQYKKLHAARKVVFVHDDRGRIVDMDIQDMTRSGDHENVYSS
ncbi:poly-beta-1,6-N-acetyl-D-glucosamine biosynthesis protein PgaD [Corticimicrobacter populi]|uniref:Poly-beta-1,6-N-acetyl-D-glucosamine biosynthesis protein PgaD n=1 Tax=Corticimicrobacter populi TaxID=2175229 RepID=A0A2V1JWI0_9BURK|nr:poly-beta-1,6-N-acetyl-D-glucosamine biosynthesis protein PgaD [Corticimicrobacter populi]PWF22602.1 poly-beta-1,6-N-acetyl-D-glucosamine biosynthesis protein PgaD [Corticimicrobacter populi]